MLRPEKRPAAAAVTANNNNNTTKELLPQKQFFTLWDIVNESPKACELVKWPIQTKDGQRVFESWLDFVFNPRISITCDRVRLIELLKQPLIIRPEELYFHQLAEYYWKLFVSDVEGPCEIVLKQGSVEVPGERTGALGPKDQLVRWPWQRKLMFIAVCIYSTDLIQNMLPSKSTDIKQMQPRLSGLLFSILYNFRVDQGKCVSFYPNPTNPSKFRQKLLANIMNYWDYEYRMKSGMVVSKPNVLDRYKKQEKLFFLILAYHASTHYQKINPFLAFNTSVVYLGVLRMMFAIQQCGQGNENLATVGWTQGSVYKKMAALVPNFQHQDVAYVYRCARIINRIIKTDDTTLQWVPETSKQEQVLGHALHILKEIPLNTEYVNNIKNIFSVTDRQLPMIKPHVTRYLSMQALQSKLVLTWEFELLHRIEQLQQKRSSEKHWIYCIIEDQIAQPVKEYYEETVLKLLGVLNVTDWILVADIFDPEIQNTAVLVMIPNRWLYLVQAVSWAGVQKAHPGNFNTLGLAMMLFNMRYHNPIEWLIIVFRILLLKHSIDQVIKQLPEIKIHAQTVHALGGLLYNAPVSEVSKPLHPKFKPQKETQHVVMDFLKANMASAGFSPSVTFITLLLLPFLTTAKIHKLNATFLRNLLIYSDKHANDQSKAVARAENASIVEHLNYKHSALHCVGDKPTDYLDLDMKGPSTSSAPQGNHFGTFADIVKIVSHLRQNETSRNHMGTATLLALLGCVSPVLPHTQESLDQVFPALPKDPGQGPFKLGTVTVAGGFTLHIPKPVQSTELETTSSAVFNHIINDFFDFQYSDLNTNWLKSQYPENEFRVPALQVDGSSFLSLCLPEFRHNGELVNPVYTSFLNSVPAREHKEHSYPALCQALDRDAHTNKRSQSATPESNKRSKPTLTVPPLNLAEQKEEELDSDEDMGSPVYVERSTSQLTEGKNVTFDDFEEEFA